MATTTRIDIWFQIWCLVCEKDFWVANTDDDTLPDIESVKCPHCSSTFWIDDDDDLHTSDRPNENPVDGRTAP
jgi:hypothetical protein